MKNILITLVFIAGFSLGVFGTIMVIRNTLGKTHHAPVPKEEYLERNEKADEYLGISRR